MRQGIELELIDKAVIRVNCRVHTLYSSELPLQIRVWREGGLGTVKSGLVRENNGARTL